ncbi:uncharacterized protein LOC117807193 [Xyrichtys novacula]|uniref:Uncharacterized protein LOC117807193 n=1 Tax=Xyrichtys novacula TaxID=13765 RepID=A0AAV1HQI5_XYRNO|nr:uncharacterized protein LOC117807193 [Xyrichtys novacula]
MKFLLSSLLLASFCTLSSYSVSPGLLAVIQTPHVSVIEGDRVNITCCWTGEFERVSVNWLKNRTDIKRDIIYQGNNSRCSYLVFPNITKAHLGRYICQLSVDIPHYYKTEGNGTVITVEDRENTDDNSTEDTQPGDTNGSPPPSAVIISLGVVAPVLLISLLCFCFLKRKQAKALRVIYEVPHIDSEVAEMDKHSTTSSTGSSQWCQVPVYESFDYFERVQNRDKC